MDWSTIRPAIKTLLEILSGLDVVWRDQKRPLVSPTSKAILTAKISLSSGVGTDEVRFEDTDDGLISNVVGWRRFVLSIQCESFSQDDEKFAFNHLETVRDRLKWPSSREALNAANVSIAKIENTISLDPALTENNRVFSFANVDVRCNAVSVEQDTSFGGGWIETVAITGLGETSIATKRGFDPTAFSSGFVKQV